LQIRFEDQQVTSVAFNSEHDEMVAYTSMQMLCVCTAAYKPYRQRMSSLVVAFSGAKVYCLHNLNIKAEDVPLSSIVQQYIDARSWQQAYKVACLGVTQEDWRNLANAALLDLNIEIARKAFIRTQDLLMINLVHRLDLAAHSGQHSDLLKGDVLTYQVGSARLSPEVTMLWIMLRTCPKKRLTLVSDATSRCMDACRENLTKLPSCLQALARCSGQWTCGVICASSTKPRSGRRKPVMLAKRTCCAPSKPNGVKKCVITRQQRTCTWKADRLTER
jgi:hypothetical protein